MQPERRLEREVLVGQPRVHLHPAIVANRRGGPRHLDLAEVHGAFDCESVLRHEEAERQRGARREEVPTESF